MTKNVTKSKVATPFTVKVIKVIRQIPHGKIATYAQIAKLAGNPRAVRGVVWILHSSSVRQDLPWHRVINSKGRISFPSMSEQELRQRKLLLREGIEFGAGDTVDLKIHQWRRGG